jgi:hypothetical protein
MTFSSPEKKRSASKSPSPTFRVKKSKAGEESGGSRQNQVTDPPRVGFWNQKLDFIARDSMQFTVGDFRILLTFDNALPDDSTFKSFGLELIILVNSGGFPILIPPAAIGHWKFLGYFSIFFVSSRIALFGSPDCPQTTLDKASAFMKDLQGTFQLLLN